MSYLFSTLSRLFLLPSQAIIFIPFFTISSQAMETKAQFATLDWTVAETLFALGEEPLTIGDAENYTHWAKKTYLPKSIQHLSIHLKPTTNQALRISHHVKSKPLIFINGSFYAQMTPALKKYASRVEVVHFYQEGNAWVNVLDATQRIAEIIGKPDAFEILLNQYSHTINKIAPLVKPFTDRPMALIQFINSRHVRIYASNSSFGQVLNQLGFLNSWQGSHNHWGFETIEVAQLAQLPKNSRFVIIKPYPKNIDQAIKYDVLWQKLEMARDPIILPEIWMFGGIPSAQNFAESFANALIQGGEK